VRRANWVTASGTNGSLLPASRSASLHGMKKRVLSAVLWAYVTWYACNIIGAFAGVALPGAILGLVAAALVFGLPILRQQPAAGATVAAPSTLSAES
jgi:hypothetical protein